MHNIKKQEGFEGQLLFKFTPGEINNAQKHPVHRQLYATDIGYYPYAANHFVERTTGINSNILIHCVSGHGWYKIDNEKYDVYEGEFFVIPAGIPHQYGSQKGWRIYWVHIEGESSSAYVDTINKNGIAPKSEPIRNVSIDIFRDLLKQLSASFTSSTISYIHYSISHLLGGYCLYENFTENKPHTHYGTNDVIAHMKEHLQENLTLQSIAEFAELSVSRFSQIFKEETGYSPIDYYIKLKVQRAAQLLISTSYKVKDIAALCGWENPFYFSRSFSKVTGYSPKEYRKLYSI